MNALILIAYVVSLAPLIPPRTARMQGWFWSYLFGVHLGFAGLLYHLKTLGWI